MARAAERGLPACGNAAGDLVSLGGASPDFATTRYTSGPWGGSRDSVRWGHDRDRSAGPEATQRPRRPTGGRPPGDRLDVLRRHGVTNAEIFGSVARGDDHEGSDVDLLVDFAPDTSIIDIIGIQQELQDVLGVPVDLIPRSGLKPRVRARAEKDLLPL